MSTGSPEKTDRAGACLTSELLSWQLVHRLLLPRETFTPTVCWSGWNF